MEDKFEEQEERLKKIDKIAHRLEKIDELIRERSEDLVHKVKQVTEDVSATKGDIETIKNASAAFA